MAILHVGDRVRVRPEFQEAWPLDEFEFTVMESHELPDVRFQFALALSDDRDRPVDKINPDLNNFQIEVDTVPVLYHEFWFDKV